MATSHSREELRRLARSVREHEGIEVLDHQVGQKINTIVAVVRERLRTQRDGVVRALAELDDDRLWDLFCACCGALEVVTSEEVLRELDDGV